MAKVKAAAPVKSAGRGRPKKTDSAPAPIVATETPKKRGRPSKAAEIVEEAPSAPKETPRKRGRPAKDAVKVAPEPEIKSRRGRPAKVAAASAANASTPPAKRAGRPPKNAPAASLHRVAGSPRVSKRTSVASKPAARIDPRVRSKLRTRTAPVKKEIVPVPETPKRRGRPAAKAKTTAKARGRPRKDAAPVAEKKTAGTKAQNAAVTKPVVPRKRRGYTTLDVPDKFAQRVQQLLLDLQAAEAAAQEEEVQEEEVQEEETKEEEIREDEVQDEEIQEEEEMQEEPLEEIEYTSEEVQEVSARKSINGGGVDVFDDENENENENFSCSLSADADETAQGVQVDIEIREEIRIYEDAPVEEQELQMQGIIENELNGSGSEMTPGFDQDFAESAYEATSLQRAIDVTEASRLFA